MYKGSDRAVVQVEECGNQDEVRAYLDSRYVGSVEAVWRIYGMEMMSQSPTVVCLDVRFLIFYLFCAVVLVL